MPKVYEAMRDKFAQTMSYDAAQSKAAAIYNSKHPNAPMGAEHAKRKALVDALRGEGMHRIDASPADSGNRRKGYGSVIGVRG